MIVNIDQNFHEKKEDCFSVGCTTATATTTTALIHIGKVN